jgi:putative membrane protein
MMWGYYSGGMSWWMILSSLFWLGLIALIALAVWALTRYVLRETRLGNSRNSDLTPGGLSAEEILRQRYARGEIDGDTFQRMQAELNQTPARPPALPNTR